MGPNEMLRQLEALAARLGVEVRFDAFEAGTAARRGGFCRLHGRGVIVVEEGLAVLDQIEIIAAALATFDTETLYVPPEVRRRLERKRAPARTLGPSLRKTRARAGG